MPRPCQAIRIRQRGVVLITALLMTVVIAIIAITMLRSFTVLQKKAANTSDKQRAFQAAQATLSFGEWWLTQGNGAKSPVNCQNLVTAKAALGAASPGQICSNALATPMSLPLSQGINYLPPSLGVSTSGGVDSSGHTNYQQTPQLYIQSVGYSADGRAMYQLTAVGYGGASQTVAVVQSTFGLSTGTTNYGAKL